MAGTAIFDLDRTITRLPTWTRFMLFANGARPGFLVQVPGLMICAIGYKLGLSSRDAIKARALRTLAWMDRPTIETRARAFVARELATNLRPGAVAAIARHLAQGDRLIMATAAVDIIAEPLAQALGFHEVLATRLNWAPAQGAAPALLGSNCYGVEKLRRIAQSHAETPHAAPVHAYSDHVSDLDMLRQADHGIAVNPSSGLRRAAPTHGIVIVNFDAPLLSESQE
ncbi:MAG: HAD-IB family phosphatase [Paracoccaceae bacterium]|nr:HAD-IB family phosphatase [Paracoccaceae bacterium]